jgi:hypothetical protein
VVVGDGVDAVVLSTGRTPLDGLGRAAVHAWRRARRPGPLAAATYEGQMFARQIGEPGAPASVCDAYFRADGPELTPYPADVARPGR